MGRGIVVSLAVTLSIAACTSTTEPEGVWELEEFTFDGDSQTVVAGTNAARAPWVSLDGESITGNAGCNSVGGTYDISAGFLSLDLFMNAAFCGPDDRSFMASEQAFAAVVHGGAVEVSFHDDRMVWSNGVDSLEFVSVDTPPTTEAFVPPRLGVVGRLDCTPGFVSEVRVADTGQPPLEIAKEADPNVVNVEPGEPLWYSGLDAEGSVVVKFALGDADGADYQVWTCED